MKSLISNVFAFIILIFAFFSSTVLAQIEEKKETVTESSAADKSTEKVAVLETTQSAVKKSPVGQDVVGFGSMASNVGKGLVFTLAALLVVFAVLKQFQNRRDASGNSPIEIIARRAVTGRTSLVLAKVDGKRFLLSATAEDLQLIAAIDDETAVTGGSFSELLAQEALKEDKKEVVSGA